MGIALTQALQSNKPCKVIFAPDWSIGNPYQSMLRRAVEATGCVVTFDRFPSGLFPLARLAFKHRAPTALHLHWINDLIAPVMWASNEWFRLVKIWLLAADMLLVRLSGTRIVWTIHNLVGHESQNPRAELLVRRVVAMCATHIILHSESARSMVQKRFDLDLSRKSSVVRHGNYKGCYPPNEELSKQLAERWRLNSSTTTVLSFGAIRPYKGLERLLSALATCARQDLRLVVAGRPFDRNLEIRLKAAAADDDRIVLALDFIPDSEVAAYFSLADVVAIPSESTLTSGSAVLAMTLGKAMILPVDAQVLDLVDETGAVFFNSDCEFVAALNGLHKPTLAQMGEVNRRIAACFDWHAIGCLISDIYTGTRR